MAVKIPRLLVEYVLLGPTSDRRQLQDSPILGDAWIAFADHPDEPCELLIAPYRTQAAGQVARAIDSQIKRGRKDPNPDPNIAYLHGVVAASLYFREVLAVVVPMTEWWNKSQNSKQLASYFDLDGGPEKLNAIIDKILDVTRNWGANTQQRHMVHRLESLDRYVALAGLILWAGQVRLRGSKKSKGDGELDIAEAGKSVTAQTIADLLTDLLNQMAGESKTRSLVWQISLNRTATPAISRSVPAVKGDAARRLFDIDCSSIGWAVIDSGIDGTHPTFLDKNGNSRIVQCFDFSSYRKIVSLGNRRKKVREKNLAALGTNRQLPPDADSILRELERDNRQGRPINWERVEKLVAIDGNLQPPSDHGTHVAGIIGANSECAMAAAEPVSGDCDDGMCPDIRLYDFRVLAPSIEDSEFAIIAALQYIRYLNEKNDYISIHGANLSLSIPHDVRNYACGRTPICVECERLVDSGVVVVAAAGNLGYLSFETAEGSYEGYKSFSVTDPGNADGVITVGATHRFSPHTYGVSFFSSRGPTGDGRMKPDLVAPGERIRAPILNKDWGDHDGTSMAAPHVSGAAAMLMARYTELIGQPRRIKQVLCESATDLGRERSFQGKGMLDVLRAFQSV